MAREHAVILAENLRIPMEALTFEGFRRWVHSPGFPDTGRIDYLAGNVEVDMSPEDLHTHGIVKVAITSALHTLVAGGGLGEVFSDHTRVVSRFARLSAEPDVVVVLWESLQTGRVRYVPAASGKPDRYNEIESTPDVIVEVVSDSSKAKDTKRLPPLYARAGIPEIWIADTRGPEVRFQIHALDGDRYIPAEPDDEGWMRSNRLGLSFRLTRHSTPVSTWYYVLESRR
jgi:Uma2 family endonuclease